MKFHDVTYKKQLYRIVHCYDSGTYQEQLRVWIQTRDPFGYVHYDEVEDSKMKEAVVSRALAELAGITHPGARS